MLPISGSKGRSSSATSRSNSMLPQYLRRIIKWQQMDVEYTFWQMLHLCTSPKVVYQHTKYHKQTKNQWARDDPAFVVICSLLLLVATMAYCAAQIISPGCLLLLSGTTTVPHMPVFVVISVLLFHFLIMGAVLATFCWFLTNSYLREESPNSHVVEQRVEWQVRKLLLSIYQLYAFDVHCNSFFPLFVMLYVIHYFLSPLLVAHGFIPVLLSNLLFMVAACYYHYLNFLGYDGKLIYYLLYCFSLQIKVLAFVYYAAVLPFLERTTFFLYPIGVFIVLSPILILSGFNPSRYFMNMYFSQRL
ncbi:hypothetical protein Pint_33850 [Pistacia integerrima]|uniref:Uncharacterized protein n=1 Tax=Pistacia integerrima TaxID=434235 RepID=A0ACC0X853_9ROSI|nr:hypothetical protein Pint_33850 [Pistacia integerrima]